MNKFLISKGSAELGAIFIANHGGFTAGQHDEPLLGYFAKLLDNDSEAWNSMGHGLTYDLAIVSLWLLTKKGELPSPPECFSKTNFYLEN